VDFSTVLLRVVLVGSTIGFISVAILLVAFRAFGKPFRANVLVAILLAFVLMCCLALMRLSLVK